MKQPSEMVAYGFKSIGGGTLTEQHVQSEPSGHRHQDHGSTMDVLTRSDVADSLGAKA
jgi:hypothetical protein